MKPRRKYGNEPTTADGHRFASKKEARRYGELRLMERAGLIAELEVHPRYELWVKLVLVCRYEADFAYLDVKAGHRVVEDVKSAVTRRNPVYRLKAKLLAAVLGIRVVEV